MLEHIAAQKHIGAGPGGDFGMEDDETFEQQVDRVGRKSLRAQIKPCDSDAPDQLQFQQRANSRGITEIEEPESICARSRRDLPEAGFRT